MSKQTINLGLVANDGKGDTLRDAGQKINSNFTEVYAAAAAASNTAQAAFDYANTTIGGTQADTVARDLANSATNTAQAAFDYANTIVSDTQVDPWARQQANAAFDYANTTFDYSNTSSALAQAAFDYANTIVSDTQVDPWARQQANAAFDYANTIVSDTQVDPWARQQANAAFIKANTVPSTSDGSYLNFASNTGIQLQYDPTLTFIDSNIANGSWLYVDSRGLYWESNTTGQYITTSIDNLGKLTLRNNSSLQDIPDDGNTQGVFLTVNNNQFQFDTGGRLHLPNDLNIKFGGITAPGNINLTAGSQQFSFGSDGGLSIPQDLNVGGQSVFAGNVTFNGTVTIPGTITQVSGNSGSYFGYASNGVNALYAGIPTYTPLPDTVFQTSGYVNGYVQNNFENTHPGNQASAEWVVTADNGTDSTGYIDYGIAGSGWDGTQQNSLGDAVLANDGWVYVQNGTGTSGGHLILGTTTEGKKVKINAGGPGAANTVAYFDNTGLTVSANVSASNFNGNMSWNNITDKPTIPTEYTLPTATGSVLGGIKIGSGLSIDGSGVVTVSSGGAVDANTLTGTTLSSNVTSSNLTSVGTLNNLTTSGNITRSGNISSAAWTINGAGLKLPAATYTDTSSSGTIGTNVAHAIGVPTFASTNVTTISNAIGLYLAGDPVGGTNTTVTAANSYAFYNSGKSYFVGAVKFNGALQSGGGATAMSFSNSLITANMPITVSGAVTASGGFASGTSSYNFQSLPSAVNGNGFTGTGAVLIDIWKFSVPSSGNRSLQFTRGAGSVDANFIGSEMHFNSGSVTGSALSGTTSGSWQYFNSGHQFGNGDVAVYTFNDTTNNKTYRVTVVYTSLTNSSITAERIA